MELRNRVRSARVLYLNLVQIRERTSLKLMCLKLVTAELRCRLTGIKRGMKLKFRRVTTFRTYRCLDLIETEERACFRVTCLKLMTAELRYGQTGIRRKVWFTVTVFLYV
jgi:hypothetical protein